MSASREAQATIRFVDEYCRTWIECGLKQAKDVLGWADFRMTGDEQNQKGWELVMSAFHMVSLFADAFNDACPLAHQQFARHPRWNNQIR
jgi:hypothetical protein